MSEHGQVMRIKGLALLMCCHVYIHIDFAGFSNGRGAATIYLLAFFCIRVTVADDDLYCLSTRMQLSGIYNTLWLTKVGEAILSNVVVDLSLDV